MSASSPPLTRAGRETMGKPSWTKTLTSRLRSGRPTRADLEDAGFLVAVLGIALSAFSTTFDGPAYLIAGGLGILLGTAVAYLGNVLKAPGFAIAAGAIAAFFLAGGAVAVRQDSLAGILPTGQTLGILSSTWIDGWKQLLTTVPPIDSSSPLLALPYLLMLSVSALSYAMARRSTSTVLPIFFTLAAFVLIILLGAATPLAALPQGVGFAVLALCWAVIRSRRVTTLAGTGRPRRAQLGIGAAIIALAAGGVGVAGSRVPGYDFAERLVLRSYVDPPFDISAYPSPLSGFRKYTQGAKLLWDQELIAVQGLPTGTPIRFATLDAYNGTVWSGAQSTSGGGFGSYLRVGEVIPATPEGGSATDAADELTATITIKPAYAAMSELNVWLPSPGPASRIKLTGDTAVRRESLRYNMIAGQAVLSSRLLAGDTYVVTAQVVRDVGEDTQPHASNALDTQSYAFVSAQANKWGNQAPTVWEQVSAIAASLRKAGAYSDGTAAGETEFHAGHYAGWLSAFLNRREPVGNDEQYAAAFALLANQAGMPARLVLGATVPASGVIRGQDVHAWVEVHVADGTWRRIPQTLFMPDRSKKPNAQPPDPVTQQNAQIVPPPNAARPPGSIDALMDADPGSLRSPQEEQEAPRGLPSWLIRALAIAAFPVGAGALYLGLVVGAKSRRRRRRFRRGTTADRIAGGWDEIVDLTTDRGHEVPVAATRREQGTALSQLGLDALAGEADRAVFGFGDPSEEAVAHYWQSVRAARRSLDARAGSFSRLRGSLSLRSMARRRRRIETPTPAPRGPRRPRRFVRSSSAPHEGAA